MALSLAVPLAFAQTGMDGIAPPASSGADIGSRPGSHPGSMTGAAARRHLEELDMLERARAEQAASRRLPERNSFSDAAHHGDVIRRQAIDAEVQRRVSEAERQAELDELSARLKAKGAGAPVPPSEPWEAHRAARPHVAESTVSAQRPAPREEPFAGAPEYAAPADRSDTSGEPRAGYGPREEPRERGTRTTIVLAMNPGHTGIRRNNPTADPIICIDRTCWISRGPDRDARAVTRSKALGPGNTLGNRAASCNASTVCIFRNVDLGAQTAFVQPIDLRILRHDRREPRMVRIDHDCTPAARAADCGAQEGPDYSLWVIPEEIGSETGGANLVALATRSRLSSTPRRSAARAITFD